MKINLLDEPLFQQTLQPLVCCITFLLFQATNISGSEAGRDRDFIKIRRKTDITKDQ